MTCPLDSGSVYIKNCQNPKNNSRRIANTDYFMSYNVNSECKMLTVIYSSLNTHYVICFNVNN